MEVPTGMNSHVHDFEARERGTFRISLTYDSETGTGNQRTHRPHTHRRLVLSRTLRGSGADHRPSLVLSREADGHDRRRETRCRPRSNVLAHGLDRKLSVDEVGGIQLVEETVTAEA
jgi:hypothetical protein